MKGYRVTGIHTKWMKSFQNGDLYWPGSPGGTGERVSINLSSRKRTATYTSR